MPISTDNDTSIGELVAQRDALADIYDAMVAEKLAAKRRGEVITKAEWDELAPLEQQIDGIDDLIEDLAERSRL